MSAVRVIVSAGPVLVDAEDAFRVACRHWATATGGRLYTRIYKSQEKGRRKFFHAYIQNYLFGSPVGGLVWDHINGDSRDNRRSNLRLASQRENARNSAIRNTNTSGVKGVWFRRDRGYWTARITVDYRNINLGAFPTLESAAEARGLAERKHFGEFAPSVCRAGAA